MRKSTFVLSIVLLCANSFAWAGGKGIQPSPELIIESPNPLKLQRLMEGVYKKGKFLPNYNLAEKSFVTRKLPDFGSRARVTIQVYPLQDAQILRMPPYEGPIPPDAAKVKFFKLAFSVQGVGKKWGKTSAVFSAVPSYAAIFRYPNSPVRLTQTAIQGIMVDSLSGSIHLPGSNAIPFKPFIERVSNLAVRAVARAK